MSIWQEARFHTQDKTLGLKTYENLSVFFKNLQECHRQPTPYQPHSPGKSRLVAYRAGVQYPHCCVHKCFPIPVLHRTVRCETYPRSVARYLGRYLLRCFEKSVPVLALLHLLNILFHPLSQFKLHTNKMCAVSLKC